MRLRVRTLGSEECEVSVQPDETVLDLKKKIEAQIPRMQADKQKLVHAGKVLEDRLLIKDYPQLKENERLVVLVTKQVTSSASVATPSPSPAAPQAPAPAASSGAPPAAPSSGPAAAPSPAALNPAAAPAAAGAGAASPAAATPAAATPAAATPAAEPQQRQQQQQQEEESNAVNESAAMLATGPQLQESIRNLEEMGFPSEMVRVALRAAFNNPDRAVEYLMNGIPEDLFAPEPAGGAPARGPPAGGAPASGAPPQAPVAPPATAGGPTAGENPLAALRMHPTFLQVRQLVQTNPQMLPQVLQMIGTSNPDLLELITQNQEAFLELLQEGAPQAGGAPREGGPAGSPLLQGGVVHLTEEEMEAVDRLTALGFTRMQVAEAYIACDRNEEMAANYLFENMNDFVEDEAPEEPPAS